MKLRLDAARTLDLDIECRPLTWIGGDFVSREITAIAASFGLDEPVEVWLLGVDDPGEMLREFSALVETADVLTGHYLSKFDLPNINGALLEHGMSPLPPRLVSDTKCDLIRVEGVSKSQESLADMLGTDHRKVHMPQVAWRAANRLEDVESTRARVEGDVRQHQELRLKLLELGMLAPAKMWHPDGKK